MASLTSFGLTDFDLIIVILTLLSMIIGLIRGFSREILSITSWIGAILLSLHLRPFVLPLVKKYLTNSFFAEPITIFIIFFFCFAVLTKISQMISKTIKSSVIGILDRLMGLGFGVIRASVLFGASYMIYSTISPDTVIHEKDFLEKSKTLPVIKTSVTLIQILLPQDLIQATQKEIEGWIDEKVTHPEKKQSATESWPQDQKETAKDLSKINITPEKNLSESPKPNIAPAQKEKLNRILEGY
jgi:membrane protein required for colicin V production